MTHRRGKRWTRKEHLAVLFYEVTLRDELTSPQNHPLTEQLAKAMGRNVAAISYRIGNYRALDDDWPGDGLDGGGAMVDKIWREYEANPDQLLFEAWRAWQEFIPDEKVKRGFYALRSNATGTQANTDPPTTNRPPQPAPPPPPHEKDKLFLEQRVDLLEECCDHLKSEIEKLRGYLASENKWKKALDALLADLEEEP